MKKRGLALVVILVLGVAGCKQADGPMPDPNAGDRMNDLGDIGKDLMAIQAKDPSGAKDFIDDLTKLCPEKAGEAATEELATRVVAAVQAGGKLTEPDSVKLGTALWQTVAGREVSSSQAKALREGVQQLLTSAGATDTDAILEQMEVVQELITRRPPRWYEFF